MDDHESHDVPHAEVVPRVHGLALAEQRDHPRREQRVRPATRLGALAIDWTLRRRGSGGLETNRK